MNDAADASSALGAQRNDVATAALGDDGFLKVRGVVLGGHYALEALQETVANGGQLRAGAGQLRASGVRHFPLGGDATTHLVHHRATGLDPGGQ